MSITPNGIILYSANEQITCLIIPLSNVQHIRASYLTNGPFYL